MIIVSCTKYNKADFDAKTALGQCFNHDPDTFKVNNLSHIFYENTRGLSVCYNEAIETYKDRTDPVYDCMVFVHDDVSINDLFLIRKLNEGLKTFDILGLAGSSDFSINRSPITWHNSPKSSWSGGVEHPYERDMLYYNSYGPTPKRCLVVDGLFIACNLRRLIETGVRFDEDFDFDFYDTSLCIRAILAGLKIGTTNIYCTHMSHGMGILEDRYKKHEATFRQKYKGKKS